MCSHKCPTCGRSWSHQDFPSHYAGNVAVYIPCPWPNVLGPNGEPARMFLCQTCAIEMKRGPQHMNGQGVAKFRHDIKEAIQKMDADAKKSILDNQRIVELQLDEEAIFKMLVNEMDDEKLEQHYNDLLQKMEMFRVRALRFRQLKADHEIEELSKLSDEQRAEYEAEKARRASNSTNSGKSVAAQRQSKQEKMISSFADKILAGNPGMTREEAVARATKMFA